MIINEILTGGQTGADRAGLDFALDHGIACGGWCPAGRRAEDGSIDPRYPLTETLSAAPEFRTKMNIINSDGTIILYLTGLDKGTGTTRDLCYQLGKPLFMCNVSRLTDPAAILEWISVNRINKLNIAGPRESNDPGIYDATYRTLMHLFASAKGSI